MSRKDPIGDRCKRFEGAEAGRRAMPGIPLLARLDGRAFHTFTRGLARPWDARFATCMLETTRTLVDELQALVGYTQSDEITLLWWAPSAAELARIPEAHRPAPGAVVERAEVRAFEMPPIRRVPNALAVLFEGAAPEGESGP